MVILDFMPTMRALAPLMALAVLAGCSSEKSPPPPTNVIFVLVDTLRADHTSLHGYERPTTPFLEELAAESHTSRFTGEYDSHDFIAAGNPRPIAEMLYADGPDLEITDDDIQHLMDLYDDEALYFDQALRKLVTDLRSSGRLDRTLLVVTSDHGEEFLEHGHVKHCRGVWNTLTHIPLIIRIPGINGGRRIDTAVQALDLAPTILDLLGVSGAAVDFKGESLRPFLEGSMLGRRFAFSDQSRYRSVDDGRFQLILDGREMTLTLVDFATNEEQLVDGPFHPDIEALGAELFNWLEQSGQSARLSAALVASTKQEEQLRALGYLE
jgi:arylsulfatase A-like enzyme